MYKWGEHLQGDHRGDRSDHGVLQDSKFAPEEQHPDREREGRLNIYAAAHPSYLQPYVQGVRICALLSLSHGPRWAAAQRRQVRLLLLDLQHEHQTGVLVA